MAKVKFRYTKNGQKKEVVGEVSAQETILEVALRLGIPIQNECGGQCSCSTCHVRVVSGLERLSSSDFLERSTLKKAKDTGATSRLACQTKILGDLEIEVVNVD